MKASSESGLWATVISRTGAETVLIEFTILGANFSETAEYRRGVPRLRRQRPRPVPWETQDAASLLQRTSRLRRKPTVPARGKPRSHQDLNDLREQEPVQSPLDRQRQRVSQREEPA